MLQNFDELIPKIPVGTTAAVERELSNLRQDRRTGGRRTTPRGKS